MTAITECCGLGCNNCILDRFLDSGSRRPNFSDKYNLFNQKDYQRFRLKDIKKERAMVYQFCFQLICDRKEPFQPDEWLIAPPLSYLMLRAYRGYDNTLRERFNPIFTDDIEELKGQPEEEDEDSKIYFRTPPQRFDKGTPEIYYSRKYTPFEVNEELRTFKIIVKMEPRGRMSRYFATLKPGDVCEFKGPFEAFPYIHEKIENYIVFTQGISIVAAFRLVKEIIYESAQSRVLVISCFKNINETFLRQDFFMLTHFWCLKHHMFLSENVEPEIPQRSGEKIHNERLTGENFRQLMKELKYFDPELTQVLISGREKFIDFAKTIVAENRYKSVAII